MMSLEETMRAYIAGPLFNEGERWHDEQIEARVARQIFQYADKIGH